MELKWVAAQFAFWIATIVMLAGTRPVTAYDRGYELESERFELHRILASRGGGANVQWEQALPNRPIESVAAALRREQGGRETVCTLGFTGAAAFTPGPMQVDSSSLHTVVWNLNGAVPDGRRLTLNCQGGEVYVDSVTVNYGDDAARGPTALNRLPTQRSAQEQLVALAREVEARAEDASEEMRQGRYSAEVMDAGLGFRDRARRYRQDVERTNQPSQYLFDNVRKLENEARDVRERFSEIDTIDGQAIREWDRVIVALEDLHELNASILGANRYGMNRSSRMRQ